MNFSTRVLLPDGGTEYDGMVAIEGTSQGHCLVTGASSYRFINAKHLLLCIIQETMAAINAAISELAETSPGALAKKCVLL